MKKDQSEAFEGRSAGKSRSGRTPDALREQAERRLSERKTPMPLQDARKMVYELQVHQIELEMQNEELRQAQGTIVASQERYADLYDFAPVGYFTFDHMGLITEVNLTGASMLGIERGQLSKKPFSLFVATPFRDTFHRHYRDVLKTGTAGTCELRLTRKDGTSFYVSVQSMPVWDAEGNLTGIRSAIGDATERTQAEEALQIAHNELEQRVQERTAELSKAVYELHDEINGRRKVEEDLARQAELLNLTHDAIIARDLNHRVFFWNRGAEERYGWSSDEVKGKVTDGLLRTAYPCPGQEIEQQLLLRGRWEGEVIHTTRDGSKIIVASRRALRRDKDGKPIAILEINSDITVEKRIEEQLRQSQKMEAVGTLAGGIAHDFNNILAAILGFTELAIDDAPEGSPIERYMTNVLKAGIRGRDLVRQILTFSRKSEYERKPLALAPLIKETFDLLRASLPTTIEMALNIKTSADMVLADATQMQQVLMNLCKNAADAMRATGGRLEIGLADTLFTENGLLPGSDMRPGTYLALTVSDTGPGMDEAVQKRIFEPFFTTKEIGQGTGLGLAVVYGTVKAHHGAITVSSEPGLGSTFTVYLPRDTSGEKAEPVTSQLVPRGMERILFVDDDEALVELGEGLLHGLGYQVMGTTDSVDALQRFSERPDAFDLVITDQTMPKMTGAILAQKLKKIRPDIPVIMCTGYSETIAPREAESMGIQAFVIKPLLKRETAETIRRVLDMKTRS